MRLIIKENILSGNTFADNIVMNMVDNEGNIYGIPYRCAELSDTIKDLFESLHVPYIPNLDIDGDKLVVSTIVGYLDFHSRNPGNQIDDYYIDIITGKRIDHQCKYNNQEQNIPLCRYDYELIENLRAMPRSLEVLMDVARVADYLNIGPLLNLIVHFCIGMQIKNQKASAIAERFNYPKIDANSE